MTVIETGMLSGEQVVINGQMSMAPGGEVEIRQPDKPGTSKPAAAAPK